MMLLAHGKDSATTEAIYTRAIKDGTVADTPTRTGAPFRIVFLQLRPDAHSFALHAGGGLVLESSWHITTWTMTIIMTRFLLKGEKDRAMHVYDKMIERGLKPNAV
ncbi:hypothetical protein B0H14DRAFT_3454621 [Mycena olivaceomarginata]|nr:hypothetical protein B0H14DRAFT_3454621 [Mycena olivaceomarginata]